jgi:hypothetical protein
MTAICPFDVFSSPERLAAGELTYRPTPHQSRG